MSQPGVKVRAADLRRGMRAYLDGLEPCWVRTACKLPSGEIWIMFEYDDGGADWVACKPERLVRVEILQ